MKVRTYSSKETKSKRSNKRTLFAVLSSCAVIIAAVAIALPMLLASNNNSGEKPEPIPAVKPISFVVPMAEYTLGMEFEIKELVYSSTLNQWRTHSGVDFIAAAGSDVVAIADGTVSDVRTTTLEGNVVVITHKDGYISTYKSLGDSVAVAKGDNVIAGDKIGVVDVTMITEQAVGAHLHLELTKNGALVDPLEFIPHQGDK